MDLGAFSLSPTVKDLAVSRAFYEKPGFVRTEEADEGTTGAAHIAVLDPDGDPLLIDQFF